VRTCRRGDKLLSRQVLIPDHCKEQEE